MAKKKKQNLQKLIAKKQQLQQVSQGPVISFTSPVQSPALITNDAPISRPSAINYQAPVRDQRYRQTAVSVGLVAVLLIGAVILDQKTAYLSNLGDWLYQALRLAP